MRRTIPSGLLLVALGAVGCQDQLAPTSPPEAPETALAEVAALPGFNATVDVSAVVPGGRVIQHDYSAGVRGIIAGENFQCTPSTPLFDYLDSRLLEIVAAGEFNLLLNLAFGLPVGVLDIPVFDALVILEDDPGLQFGFNGEFTRGVTKTERDLKSFWAIPSDDIEVVPMQGSVLVEADRIAALYELFGFDPVTAAIIGDFIATQVAAAQSFDGGDHPIFTFNAVAASFGGPFPDRIALGDGVLEGYEMIGLGDIGLAGIFAHEFAHHVQFELGVFEDEVPVVDEDGPDGAEATRYTELMADAMAAYYLTHKRGGTYNWWRAEQFLQVFFNVGDCAFDNDSHHGTPEQRLRTARWAYELAQDAQKQGQILPPEEFVAIFNAAFPDLVAPDIGEPAPDGNIDPGNSPGKGDGQQR